MSRHGRPVRRLRRVIDDASVTLWLYSDGFIRIKVDHPSDDILVEVGIAHRIMDALASAFGEAGLDEPKLVEARWRTDPPEVITP